MIHRTLAVLEADLIAYRRTWHGSALSSFVVPLLLIPGFGLGVGWFVDAPGTLGTGSYLDFVVPGMIASIALQTAFSESTSPIVAKFTWLGTYRIMAYAPLRVADILAGDLLFVGLRVFSTSAVFVAVTASFGAVHSPWAALVPLVTTLLGLAVAAPVFGYSALIQTDSYTPLLQRFTVIPMSLFAGVFFPVPLLPPALRALAYASPLWHAVELCRLAATGAGHLWPGVGHVAYLGGWLVGGFRLAWLAFRRRLRA